MAAAACIIGVIELECRQARGDWHLLCNRVENASNRVKLCRRYNEIARRAASMLNK